MDELSEERLSELLRLSEAGAPPPWTSWIEGRDHEAGDSFVEVGSEGHGAEGIYVTRDGGPALPRDLDLIAAARNSLPPLIAEVRKLRQLLQEAEDGSARSQ